MFLFRENQYNCATSSGFSPLSRDLRYWTRNQTLVLIIGSICRRFAGSQVRESDALAPSTQQNLDNLRYSWLFLRPHPRPHAQTRKPANRKKTITQTSHKKATCQKNFANNPSSKSVRKLQNLSDSSFTFTLTNHEFIMNL